MILETKLKQNESVFKNNCNITLQIVLNMLLKNDLKPQEYT